MTAAPLPDGFVAHDGGKMPIAAGINVTVLDRGGDQIGPLQSGWFVTPVQRDNSDLRMSKYLGHLRIPRR